MTETSPRAIGEMRRYYQGLKVPVCSSARARADVLQLLDERKSLQRAAEAVLAAAAPYSGDTNLKAAMDGFRAVLEGRKV